MSRKGLMHGKARLSLRASLLTLIGSESHMLGNKQGELFPGEAFEHKITRLLPPH